MPPPPEEIAAGLARLRRRERLIFIVWTLFIPVVLLVGWVADLLSSPHVGETAAMSAAFAWMAVFAAAGLRLAFSKCPRCGGFFQFGLRRRWRACVHCGLSLTHPAPPGGSV